MSKEMEFFIYLLEHYAYYKHTTADKVLKILMDLNILDDVFNGYEFYHIERLQNAYDDIDKMIKESKENKNIS